MKLYSTITSERATKAQGGNKYIEFYLGDEGRNPLISVYAEMITESPNTDNTANITIVRHDIKSSDPTARIVLDGNFTVKTKSLGLCYDFNCHSKLSVPHSRDDCRPKGKKQKGEMDKFIENIDLPQ